MVTSKGVGSTFVKDSVPDVARSYRDDLAKIRDDPLFAIKQQEKKARERILDNPLKVAEFKKELDEKRKRKAERKEAKKAKKEAKKAHKHSRDRTGTGSPEASPSRCLCSCVASGSRASPMLWWQVGERGRTVVQCASRRSRHA